MIYKYRAAQLMKLINKTLQTNQYDNELIYLNEKYIKYPLSHSQNVTNQPKSAVELGYMCPRVLFDPPVVTFTK